MTTKLRQARLAAGLSVTQTGFALRVNPSLISQIESRSRYAYPKIRRELAKLLQVNEQELFDPEGMAKLA
ncbi:MAG: XRE family transcriptional regulator [Clostridia bacterium]|nr:MAG: XRE family transcriptional regulator [Clostridia bacterium]